MKLNGEQKGDMASYVINKDGKPLSKTKYSVDKRNRVFITKEQNIELDFSEFDNWTFIVKDKATITAGNNSIFNGGDKCIFRTKHYCTFHAGSYCKFRTGSDCTFRASNDCEFNTGSACTFRTDNYGTFNTGGSCTFRVGWHNDFKTGAGCTFLIHQIKFQKFDTKYASGSIIYDGNPSNKYVLNDDLIRLIKLMDV